MPDKLNSQDVENPSTEAETQDGTEINQSQTELVQTGSFVRAPRSQIRAAINSVYNTRPVTAPLVEPGNKPTPAEPEKEPVSVAEPEREKRAEEVELLLEKAVIFTRTGDKERARQIYSKAVRLAPESSDAWSGLGSLLIEQNPERSRYCFNRALAIDPENTLAILMLKTLDEPEEILSTSSTSQALARIEQTSAPLVVPEEAGIQTSSADGEAAPSELDKTEVGKKGIKIGLEEALAIMRESGQEVDEENVPLGGARFRAAIESGILKPGRIRPRRRIRIPLPRISISGLALSLALLISLALLSGVGLYVVVTQPSFAPPPATPTPFPTTPIPTLTADEAFTAKLRLELDRYNRQLANVKNLVDQQRANKLQWEDFRKGFDDLQKQVKDEKKTVDGLAVGVANRLLTPYRGLQDLAVAMINGADYMVSGIHNYEPDDLDEGLRQFSRASGQLAEIAAQLNQLAPLPQPTVTPTISSPVQNFPTSISLPGSDGTVTNGAGSTTTSTPDLTPSITLTPNSAATSPAPTSLDTTPVATAAVTPTLEASPPTTPTTNP